VHGHPPAERLRLARRGRTLSGPEDGDERERPQPVEVPHTQLSAEALRGLVESFVNREGTDYGWKERSFESKVSDVMRQLESGEAVVVYDPESESINVVSTS
jgi:uncharacterized protein YheU (UPF0270 family)